MEATVDDCWGPTVAIDHSPGPDGDKLIALYGHLGEMLVEAGETVSRGQAIGKLGDNHHRFRCMGGTRHLHFQLGRKYRATDKGVRYGNEYFLEDARRGLNPHLFWADGVGKVTCFRPGRTYPKTHLTYPVPCKPS